MAHHTENELADIVVDILRGEPGRQASYARLIAEIPRRTTLLPGDVSASSTRPGEQVWEQRVRNITSHKNSADNYIARGILREIDGGLALV